MSFLPWFMRLTSRLAWTSSLREKQKFEAQARDAANVNADTLRSILHHNRDTEFGRRYGFASLRTVADYQRALPVSTYEPFRPYMERIAWGEQDVLTADKVEFLGITSGTTGQRKLLPITRHHGLQLRRAAMIGRAVVAEKVPASRRPARGMVLMNAVLRERSQGGLLMGALTSISVHSLGRAFSAMTTSPREAFLLRAHTDALYLHLLFGLREREMGFLQAPFASGLLDMVHLLERRGAELVEDIGRGVLRPELELEPAQRRQLQARLRPAPERARELAQALQQGPHGLVRRLWPQLAYVSSITGGGFSLYTRQLAPYLEGLPFYPSSYVSTEGCLGVSLELERPLYCLLPGAAFFEFIPEQELDAETPRTLLPGQLVEGRPTSWC
jgi:hypothetical protein